MIWMSSIKMYYRIIFLVGNEEVPSLITEDSCLYDIEDVFFVMHFSK